MPKIILKEKLAFALKDKHKTNAVINARMNELENNMDDRLKKQTF